MFDRGLQVVQTESLVKQSSDLYLSSNEDLFEKMLICLD